MESWQEHFPKLHCDLSPAVGDPLHDGLVWEFHPKCPNEFRFRKYNFPRFVWTNVFFDSWCVLISFLVVTSPGSCPFFWQWVTSWLVTLHLWVNFKWFGFTVLHVLFISQKKHGKRMKHVILAVPSPPFQEDKAEKERGGRATTTRAATTTTTTTRKDNTKQSTSWWFQPSLLRKNMNQSIRFLFK